MYITREALNPILQGFSDYHVFSAAPQSVDAIIERHLREGKVTETARLLKEGQLVSLPSHR